MPRHDVDQRRAQVSRVTRRRWRYREIESEGIEYAVSPRPTQFSGETLVRVGA